MAGAMIWAVLALWLVLAAPARAAIIMGISFDESDDAASNPDSFLFDETGTDSQITLDSAVAHASDNGGSSTSRMALKVTTPGSTTPKYVLKNASSGTPITLWPAGNTGAALSVAVHVPENGQFTDATGNKGKPIACFLESSTSDYGCCLVAEQDRLFSVAYFGSDEGDCNPGSCDADEQCYGTKCRKVWGKTAVAAQYKRCSKSTDVSCTTGGSECPATETCGGAYFQILEITQHNQSASSVRCDLYASGQQITGGDYKSLTGTPAADIDNGIALGFLDPANVDTSKAATLIMDSVVLATTQMRIGRTYVASVRPTDMADCATVPGCAKDWVTSSCRASNPAVWSCVNDYSLSPYKYDSGTDTDKVMKGTGKNKKGDLPVFETPSLVGGESVLGVDLYAIGKRSASSSREFTMGLLSCRPDDEDPTDIAGNCVEAPWKTCSESLAKSCMVNGDCTGTCGARVVPEATLSHTSYATPRVLGHYFSYRSPRTDQTSWAEDYKYIGMRVDTKDTTANRSIFVGAVAANVIVKRPDTTTTSLLTDRNEDGKRVIALIGASTLLGTAEMACVGGAAPGQACTQDSYCEWDDNEDTPAGGCAASPGACYVCTQEQTISCNNGGSPDNDLCTFGACSGGTCTGDTDRLCSTSADCDKGPCFTATTGGACVDACPDDGTNIGVCPANRAGWGTPIAEVPGLADVIAACAVGGESSGSMFQYRYDDIQKGRATGPACTRGFDTDSCCELLVGSGVCECRAGQATADCGTNGVCTSGLCSAGSDAAMACTRPSHCNTGADQGCYFGKPDEIGFGMGVNDSLPTIITGWRTPLYHAHDPECRTIASAAGQIVTLQRGQPTKWCPSIDSDSPPPEAWEVTATSCSTDAGCSGVAADSKCFGRCLRGTEDGMCVGSGECPLSRTIQPGCTLDAPTCDVSGDCTLGRTCVGGHPEIARGVLLDGRCACTTNANCPTNFICVKTAGDAAKYCRRRCGCQNDAECGGDAGSCSGNVCQWGAVSCAEHRATTCKTCSVDGDCGTANASCTGNQAPWDCCTGSGTGTCGCQSGICNKACGTSAKCSGGKCYSAAPILTCDTATCDTGGNCDSTDATHGFCPGRCAPTCSAMSCTKDSDCGGTTLSEQWTIRSATFRGICNPASGKCANCGFVMCGDYEALLKRGCSCATDADCGSGGSCNAAKECVSGDADRTSCQTDLSCALGQRCLRPAPQLREYQAAHHGLFAEVAQRILAKNAADLDYGKCSGGTCVRNGNKSCAVDADCDDRPGLTVTATPMPGGLTALGFIFPDIACWQRSSEATWSDRASYARTYHDLLGIGLPSHRVVLPTEYNRRRMHEALLVDQVHTTSLGSQLAGQPFADLYQKLDVCVDNNAPVTYCQQANGQFKSRCTCSTGADCGTGGNCTNGFCKAGDATRVVCTSTPQCAGGKTCKADVVCSTTSQCAAGEKCVRRKCSQNEADCPGATDTCHPD